MSKPLHAIYVLIDGEVKRYDDRSGLYDAGLPQYSFYRIYKVDGQRPTVALIFADGTDLIVDRVLAIEYGEFPHISTVIPARYRYGYA